jgi:hypothetical protein
VTCRRSCRPSGPQSSGNQWKRLPAGLFPCLFHHTSALRGADEDKRPAYACGKTCHSIPPVPQRTWSASTGDNVASRTGSPARATPVQRLKSWRTWDTDDANCHPRARHASECDAGRRSECDRPTAAARLLRGSRDVGSVELRLRSPSSCFRVGRSLRGSTRRTRAPGAVRDVPN